MNNLISVCICTHKRPALLEKLLISLYNQKNIDDFRLELIVVENDTTRLSEPVIGKIQELIKDNPRYSIKYDIQPIKNIAITRNKTVELAEGNYIFFIDDDEYADELCIYHHLSTIKKFNADVTIGNVLPYFEDTVPDYIRNAYPYHKLSRNDGGPTKNFMTSNTMVYICNIAKNQICFDSEYGVTGGSDHRLFMELYLMGFKIIDCANSFVYEYIPPQRANIIWLSKRVFRTGNNYTRTLLQEQNNIFKKTIVGLAQIIKGISQFLISMVLMFLFFFIDKSKSFNWYLKAISNLSKPFAVVGFYPKEYKN